MKLRVCTDLPSPIIELFWSNVDILKFYEYHQSANFIDHLKNNDDVNALDNEFFEYILSIKIQNKFDQWCHDFRDIEYPKTILSVGPGCSTFELMLSKYYKGTTFYLVDEERFNLTDTSPLFKDQKLGVESTFQNSWNPLLDGIATNNIERSRFELLNTTDDWPDNIDIIDSQWAWGWHFSSEHFEDLAIRKLRTGGKIRLWVLAQEPRNMLLIDKLTKSLGSEPIVSRNVKLLTNKRSKIQYPHLDHLHLKVLVWTKTSN